VGREEREGGREEKEKVSFERTRDEGPWVGEMQTDMGASSSTSHRLSCDLSPEDKSDDMTRERKEKGRRREARSTFEVQVESSGFREIVQANLSGT